METWQSGSKASRRAFDGKSKDFPGRREATSFLFEALPRKLNKEAWQSGLMQHPAKMLYSKGYRRFESSRLRSCFFWRVDRAVYGAGPENQWE